MNDKKENKEVDSNELRKEKLKTWLSDKYNLYFLGILIFAFIIRLYYFILTKSQPLWWDEAEYMLRAKAWVLHTPLTGFAVIREGIIPFFWGILYFLSRGEWLARFFQVLVSSVTVFFTFIIAKKILDKKTALIAAFFMAVYSIHLFFTARLLTYLWVPLIYLIVLYFFFKRHENKKYLYISVGLLAFGVITYFSTLFLAALMIIILLVEQKMSFFKRKETWIALLIFLLVLSPFVTYYMITKHVPLPRFMQLTQIASNVETTQNLPFSQWWGYPKDFPRLLRINNTYLSTTNFLGLWLSKLLNFVWLIVLIFSLYTLLELAIGFDLVLNGKSERLKHILFLWLWIIIPIFVYTFIEVIQGGGSFYDAFILPVFPAIFMLCAISVTSLSNIISKYSKKIAVVFVIILVIWVGFIQLNYASETIKGKITSFDGIKQAGLFIKDNSVSGDLIIGAAVPMLTYYAERETDSFPANESAFLSYIRDKNPRFMILSIEQQSPEWTYSWPDNNKDKVTPVNAQFVKMTVQGTEQTVPGTVTYVFINRSI